MPHLFADIPEKLRVVLSQAANVFLVLVLIYIIQYIFNSDFACSCTTKIHPIGYIYILVIPLILFFILKIVKQTRTKICATCCCGICSQILQLLGIYLFWWGFVLLDGDLVLCIATTFNDSLVIIPCKMEPTFQEKSIITIYKNWSRLGGYLVIAIGFFGWCLISNTSIGICCDNCCQKCMNCESIFGCKCCKGTPYYKRRYEELLSEETDKYLDEALQEIARTTAKSICSTHIHSIKSGQLNTHTSQTRIENAWSTISQSDFYTSDPPKDLDYIW